MSKTRTRCLSALGILAAAAGLACTAGGASPSCGGVLQGGPASVAYACNLPPPTLVVTGPCEIATYDNLTIAGNGVGTCVVEIDFPNGLKFSAPIPFTNPNPAGCPPAYVATSVREIVVGDVPMCFEPDGEAPQGCRCLSVFTCDSGALCLDAGEWDGAVYMP